MFINISTPHSALAFPRRGLSKIQICIPYKFCRLFFFFCQHCRLFDFNTNNKTTKNIKTTTITNTNAKRKRNHPDRSKYVKALQWYHHSGNIIAAASALSDRNLHVMLPLRRQPIKRKRTTQHKRDCKAPHPPCKIEALVGMDVTTPYSGCRGFYAARILRAARPLLL